MAHSLESRTPILDNELIDLSLSIPQELKLNASNLKAIIKHNARSLLPKTYFSQPKRGFPTPLRIWLRSSHRRLIEEKLLGKNSQLDSVFDGSTLREIAKGYSISPRRLFRPLDEIQSHRIWQLFSLESWLRTWRVKYNLTLRLP